MVALQKSLIIALMVVAVAFWSWLFCISFLLSLIADARPAA
jgi:hypothetical protein